MLPTQVEPQLSSESDCRRSRGRGPGLVHPAGQRMAGRGPGHAESELSLGSGLYLNNLLTSVKRRSSISVSERTKWEDVWMASAMK